MSKDPFHVIIIGAGTGGSCLAHGLKRAGIEVSVYERDRTRSDGVYGYRVGIDPDGSRALKKCLPPELLDTFFATCARDARYFNMYTEKMRECVSIPLQHPEELVDQEKSVSRMTLRQVLLTGIEDIVHFDKSFKLYEQNADGTVTAYFEDGSSATGDLLVAADGTRSRVRQQYLPHAKVRDAGIIAVTAKVPVTEETRALLPEAAWYGISAVLGPGGYTGILHVMEFPWGQDGQVKTGIGGSEAALIEKWPGLLYDNTRDYINWSLTCPTNKFPPNIMKMRGEELIKLVLDMTPKWDPKLRELIGMGDPSTCFPISIATSEPIPQWETTNVTLLGDAIHTMTPGRGVGANTALRDAALLRRNLVKVRDGELSLHDAIRDYETKMIKYGFEAVEKSRKQTGDGDPLNKPVIGRAVLAGMRTFMRLANKSSKMKQKMSKNLYTFRGGDREED